MSQSSETLSTVEDIINALNAYHVDMMYVIENIAFYGRGVNLADLSVKDYKDILLDYAKTHTESGDTQFANEVLAIATRIQVQ